MGLYRLLLALAVALSHAGVLVGGYNPGVVAVISFFLLSGHVMRALLEKYYRQPFDVAGFYIDRAARLFPQYLFHLLIATVCLWTLDLNTLFTYALTPLKWLLNVPILPLGYYMVWGDAAMVIPQAWSLGLEMSFYLLAPWIFCRFSRRQTQCLAAASLAVFVCAWAGIINTDWYGYRLLPGTLFIFIAGSYFYRAEACDRRWLLLLAGIAVLLLGRTYTHPEQYAQPYNREVLAGLLLGLAAMAWLVRRRFSALDELLGSLGYGVFLNHMLLIWLMQRAFATPRLDAAQIALMLLLSCLAAGGSYLLVERPALRWRTRLRQRSATAGARR